ncbi:unnamed protein product [Malus baccata var. baccata]
MPYVKIWTENESTSILDKENIDNMTILPIISRCFAENIEIIPDLFIGLAEGFVSNEEVPNQSLRVKGDDVGVDPMVGERLIGGGEDFGVGVVEVDSLGLERLDELHRLRWWREVVAQLAVVHTHLGGELRT